MSIRRLLTTALLVLTFTNAAFGQDKEYHGDGIDDAMRFVPLASAFKGRSHIMGKARHQLCRIGGYQLWRDMGTEKLRGQTET